MKDGIYLSSPVFASAVKAIILFGLKEDRKSYKNVSSYPLPLTKLQAWVKKRGQALAKLYGVPEAVPIVLDDEVRGGLMTSWVEAAKGR